MPGLVAWPRRHRRKRLIAAPCGHFASLVRSASPVRLPSEAKLLRRIFLLFAAQSNESTVSFVRRELGRIGVCVAPAARNERQVRGATESLPSERRTLCRPQSSAAHAASKQIREAQRKAYRASDALKSPQIVASTGAVKITGNA